MKPTMPIMAHLVLGYPTLAESIRTAAQYVAAGVQILELQIPFSHPTADGPVITAACREAIEGQQVTVEDSLRAIETIRQRFPDQEIIVMSYLNRIFTYGAARFTADMEALHIRHLIVPDLPVDSPMAASFCTESLQLVPVLAANVGVERLEKLLQMPFSFYYLMSDFKITGAGFSLHPRLKAIIERIRIRQAAARIGIGFGISTPEQALLAAKEADIAIVGSALIQAQYRGELDALLTKIAAAFEPEEVA
jgi:tryptophan synthase alpha chain